MHALTREAERHVDGPRCHVDDCKRKSGKYFNLCEDSIEISRLMLHDRRN